MTHSDLAVVGGSFAGLSCATRAATHGLDVKLFERKISPGAYTQSTGIFVKEIAERMALPIELTRKISGVRLYAPNMNYIDLSSPDYYFIATDTQRVLGWMADQAEIAGVEIHSSTQVQQIELTKSKVRLPEQHISARYLVAADGANSALAKQLGLGQNRHFLAGAEYEVEGFEELDDDKLHVFLTSSYAPGYIGWLLKGVNTVQLGVAAKPGRHIKLRPFFEFLKYHFNSKATMLSGRGGLIPCGGIVSPWAQGNACLLGDAAGMVSPLTAGGIHPSIEVGAELGNAISDYCNGAGVLPHERISPLVKRYPFKRRLRGAYNSLGMPDYAFNYLISNPLFRKSAQLLFFHHRGLFCKEAWRDILFSTAHAEQ